MTSYCFQTFNAFFLVQTIDIFIQTKIVLYDTLNIKFFPTKKKSCKWSFTVTVYAAVNALEQMDSSILKQNLTNNLPAYADGRSGFWYVDKK